MPEDRRDDYRGYRVPNDDRILPPIREMFADELDLPPRSGPYSFGDVQRALPRPEGRSSTHSRDSSRHDSGRSYSLAPIQQQAHQSYSAGTSRYTSPASVPSSGSPDPRPTRHASQESAYSYGVLRTSGASGTLVNATPPSERPQGILRQTAAPAREDQEDSNKRYKCEYCGKRFGMPSHLQIHLRTHTAQRPYACEWPNCDRTFSVRSNMMRHFRSHGSAGQQGHERGRYDDDDMPDRYEEKSSTSRYVRDSSSSASQYSSSSQYYSSSRRQ